MRKEFIEYLAGERFLPTDTLEAVRGLLRSAPEPIGTLALRYGIIAAGDIETVLDEQRETRMPFGEIAVSQGLIQRDQLDALLRVQQVRAAVEIAEAIALSRICSVDDIMAHLGRFLLRAAEPAVPA